MHSTISKIAHPVLSKDMKGPMQIKERYVLFINATLSKNQLYKLNQVNKVPTINKQDDIKFFSEYFCTSFY